MTTMSDDPSSSVLCVVCVERFPRGGGQVCPPGYAQRLTVDGSPGQRPKFFFWVVFAIFSRFCKLISD
jgi:hypothetical protein